MVSHFLAESSYIIIFVDYDHKAAPMKYDVFLSYKSEDQKIAMKINSFLTENGLTVFFSEETLGDIGMSEYSDSIDKAIDSSSHMIVVASRVDYLSHGWVHYEWSSFANNLRCGYKSGNLITILTPDIALHDLPLGLRHRQSFSTRNFAEGILPYLKSNVEKCHHTIKRKSLKKISAGILATAAILLTGLAGFILRDYNQTEYPEVQQPDLEGFIDPTFISSLAECPNLDIDTSKVSTYYDLALKGSSEAQYEIGSYCYELTMYEKALYWFTLSAKQGNAKSAYGIGRCFYNGNGIPKSPRNAYNWFERAAEGNCVEGMNNMGKCLVEGTGTIRPNDEKAVLYYKKAANLDFVPAEYNYGVHLLCGKGTEKNVEMALYWLNKAAEEGSASAQLRLGEIYREGHEDIPVDLAKAESWYLKAIDNNDEQIAIKARKNLLLIQKAGVN